MVKSKDEKRPAFALMKLKDTVSYFHMQMPRWLFFNPHYAQMSLESKVAYTFLLNRYQLSRRNGWVNRYGEVYVIYTREDLAREMQISYRKAIACFKELADKQLIWEQRRGRGLPNRIFLAEVVLDESAAYGYDCAPFCPATRHAESALEQTESTGDMCAKVLESNQDTGCETEQSGCLGKSRYAETALLELSGDHLLKERNGSCGEEKTPDLELSKRHATKKDRIKTKETDTEGKQSVSQSGRKDTAEELQEILSQCDLSRYEEDEASVLRDAVTWLYFCTQLSIGTCVYPPSYVRLTLHRLNADILDDTLYKLRHNGSEGIKNSLVYTAKVLFNTILESGSDILLDPILNRLERGVRI